MADEPHAAISEAVGIEPAAVRSDGERLAAAAPPSVSGLGRGGPAEGRGR